MPSTVTPAGDSAPSARKKAAEDQSASTRRGASSPRPLFSPLPCPFSPRRLLPYPSPGIR